MSAVELRQASRLWDGEAGLHPIDLDVDLGEMIVVRGRSGSGKSTLLALVAGVCAPGMGQVLVLGREPRLDMPWSELALVPQVLALSTELSIEENIADCGQRPDTAAVRRSMEVLDIAELARRTIGEVSMGQQQTRRCRTRGRRRSQGAARRRTDELPGRRPHRDRRARVAVGRRPRCGCARGNPRRLGRRRRRSSRRAQVIRLSVCSQVGGGGGHDESIVSFGIAIRRMHDRHANAVLSAMKLVWGKRPRRAGRPDRRTRSPRGGVRRSSSTRSLDWTAEHGRGCRSRRVRQDAPASPPERAWLSRRHR